MLTIEYENNNIMLSNNDFSLKLILQYFQGSTWKSLSLTVDGDKIMGIAQGIKSQLFFRRADIKTEYTLSFESDFQTHIRLELTLLDEQDYFHLIPCNIFGDNNLNRAEPGHFPNLSNKCHDNISCASLWEFRADRASHPVSILCCQHGAVGISIQPYYEHEKTKEIVRNGLFAKLPNSFGVSIGYTNDPVTFINKDIWGKSTSHFCSNATVTGDIYTCNGSGRLSAHKIIKNIYNDLHDRPKYTKSLTEACTAIVNCLFNYSWSTQDIEYSDMFCKVPDDNKLRAWRRNVEIGWTGNAVVAYPLFLAQHILGSDYKHKEHPGNWHNIFDRITSSYNEKSGFLYDTTKQDPMNEVVSGVNGWWAGYIVKDCHCAYTNGSALYYLFKTLARIYQQGLEINSKWLNIGLNVVDTVIHLQREDGGLGYTYATDKKQILDWDGFAGCWFAAALPFAYVLTNEKKYLNSAAKALGYYSEYVNRLECYGTPMDTWKSIDEEGILSYIKAAKLMHEITSEEKYLRMAVNGACYEYLWRYSYKAKPEFEPLKSSSWNSCGGSITSVSNPHIHPMGLLITDELYYLADKTGDHYHKDRADDAVAWAMNCLEQYPNISGYGEYGIVSERWCPSDGLIIEEYSNKTPSSLWFAYNMWAASAMLEGFCESLLSNKDQI